MGWKSLDKQGNWLSEDEHGRPVQAGEEGNLVMITQEDYGHLIVVNLINGIINIDPKGYPTIQNGTIEIDGGAQLWLCEDTSIVGDMAHLSHTYELKRDEKGRKMRDEKGNLIEIRTDHLTPLTFRPIWFTRHYAALPAPVKIIGVQVTLPELQGGANYKRMVMLFPDGRLGIS